MEEVTGGIYAHLHMLWDGQNTRALQEDNLHKLKYINGMTNVQVLSIWWQLFSFFLALGEIFKPKANDLWVMQAKAIKNDC